MARLDAEIKQLKEKRRQFLLDYHLYQLNQNGFIENEENTDTTGNEQCDDENECPTESKSVTNADPDVVVKEEPGKFAKRNSNNTTPNSKSKANTKSPTSFSPVIFQGAPIIVYSLQEYDILEDWSIIKMHSGN